MPQQKKKETIKNRSATKEKLIRAGAKIFSKHGYDAASVKKIAEESGVNVSLINRYFGGKEGLLLVLVKKLIVEKQEGQLGYPPQTTLKAEIFEYLKYRLSVDIQNDQLTRILISQIAINKKFRDNVLQAFSSETDTNFRERLVALQEQGKIPPQLNVDQVFTVISYLSFSANFLGHEIMSRPRKELIKLFDEFSTIYAIGLTQANQNTCPSKKSPTS